MSPNNESQLADGLGYENWSGKAILDVLDDLNGLNRAVELQEVLKKSISVVKKVMETESASLLLIDDATGELRDWKNGDESVAFDIEQQTGIGKWVIEHQQPYFTNDYSGNEFSGHDLSEGSVQNIMCVCLNDKTGQSLGVLQALNCLDGRDFTEQDVLVLEALANHIANAIERTREKKNIQQQLKEKEMMLTEVHHRLKNNLSTITSLIELEISEIEGETASRILRKTVSRIESMTEVHDLLYTNGLGTQIDLKDYFSRLARKISNILAHTSQDIQIEVQAESIKIDTERAMSCGLLLNELLVNCYKHAFDSKTGGGQIVIELSLSDSHYIKFNVSDDGIGIGDKFTLGDSTSIGSWLIDVLLRKLDAEVDISRENGTKFSICFKQ